MYVVYVLKSKIKPELNYIGSTNNLAIRLKLHNQGKVLSTCKAKPWELIYYEAYNQEKLARLREKRLKFNGNARRELKKRIAL